MRSDITIAVHAIARGARPAYAQDMHGILQKQQAVAELCFAKDNIAPNARRTSVVPSTESC